MKAGELWGTYTWDVSRVRILHHGKFLEDLPRQLFRNVEYDWSTLGFALDAHACTSSSHLALFARIEVESVIQQP